MNAIYARQSVDRADSISIESQIEFCQYEMRGEQYKVYTDRGYSGKNTDRPAFAEMMNDIESGVIGISELKLHKEADYTEIYNHLTMWDELSFDDKRQTVDQLIRVIYATSDSIKIEWHI